MKNSFRFSPSFWLSYSKCWIRFLFGIACLSLIWIFLIFPKPKKDPLDSQYYPFSVQKLGKIPLGYISVTDVEGDGISEIICCQRLSAPTKSENPNVISLINFDGFALEQYNFTGILSPPPGMA